MTAEASPVVVAYDLVVLDAAGEEISERLRTAFLLVDERRLTLRPARGAVWFRHVSGQPATVSVRTLPDYGGAEIRRLPIPTPGRLDLE